MAEPWATAEELRLHLRLAVIDADQAEATIAEAENVIRGDLEQTIDAVAGDVAELVGNGRAVLNLPEMPVTAITAVAVDSEDLVHGTDYRWNRYGILTRLGERIWRGHLAGCWPIDAAISVTYNHGVAEVPAVVKTVCLQVAGRRWVNPRSAASESIGDWSATYDKARIGDALTDYEQGLLARYARGPQSR